MRQKKGLKTFNEKDYKVEEETNFASSNNWYKVSKKVIGPQQEEMPEDDYRYVVAQEIIEHDPNERYPNDPSKPRPPAYTDFGHTYTKAFPILWALINGKITTKESRYRDTKHDPSWIVKNTKFCGRFEPETGILTVQKVGEGLHLLKPVPEFLITMLKQTFPNITKIMVFG